MNVCQTFENKNRKVKVRSEKKRNIKKEKNNI